MAIVKWAVTICIAGLILAGCRITSNVPAEEEQPQLTATWPMEGGNPQRNGRASVPGPYRRNVDGDTWSDVAWTIELPSGSGTYRSHYSTVVIDQHGNVYLYSNYGVYSYNSEGTERWFVPVEEISSKDYYRELDFRVSPVILNSELVICENGSNGVVALDYDGNIAWQIGYLPEVWLSFGAMGETLYAAADNVLYAINMQGEILWEYALDFGTYWETAPAISPAGDILVVENPFETDQRIAHLISSAGQLQWTHIPDIPDERYVMNFYDWPYCVYADGLWLIPALNGIEALDEFGNLVWEYDFPMGPAWTMKSAPPAITNEGLILLAAIPNSGVRNHLDWGEVSTLTALNRDGSVAWSFDEGGTYIPGFHVAVDSDDWIYLCSPRGPHILSASGQLVAEFAISFGDYLGEDAGIFYVTGLAFGPGNSMLAFPTSLGIPSYDYGVDYLVFGFQLD